MEKLNSRLGEELVRDIYLKAGKPEQLNSTPAPVKRFTRPLLAEERQKIAEQTDSVTDPELREALAELLARHMETDSID
jgi:hypothetical protein